MLNILTEYPWASTEKSLQEVVESIQKFDISAVRTVSNDSTSRDRNIEVRNRIAIINIKGSIFRYSNMFTEWFGLTTVQSLAVDINYALNNEDIDGVLFDVDSGGGQANGISELSEIISNSEKPTKAYIGGSGASAAYWLASATNEVIINKTGIAGSIGAMLEIYDDTEAMEKFGIKRTVIKSEISPNKNSDEELQTIVNRLGTEFVSDVAKNRNVSFAYVLENYGQGGLFVGEDAVNAGLVNRIGTFEDVLSSFQTSNTSSGGSTNILTKQKQIDLLNTEV